MHPAPADAALPMMIGRYAIYESIASGGMATVHLGRLVGAGGFSRTVAIKRLHPQLAQDKEIAGMLLDEARLAARIQHPNVVPTLDVVATDDQMLLVMEYVRGDSLSRLVRSAQLDEVRLPPNVVVAIVSNMLAGLHAAHEAVDERGQPMQLVHRDVSPQNVMVGVDGVARVLDFGIAKAAGRMHTTREGEVKGKVMYMPREQLAGEELTRATDIYAAGIILFEALTNSRMFAGANEVAAVTRIIANDLRMPSSVDPALAPFDAIVQKAAALLPQDRFATAREMAHVLESVCAPASPAIVGEWVEKLASAQLDVRAKRVAEIERSSTRMRENAPASEDVITGPPHASGVMAARPPAASSPSLTGPTPQLPVAQHIPAAYVTAPRQPPAATAGWIAAVVILASILLASIGGVAIFLSRRTVKPPVVVTAPAEERPAAAPPVEAAKPVVEAAPPPVAAEAPVASAASSASLPSAAPAKTKAKPRCDPPYTLDAKGHKHFIPECVH